MMWKYARRDRKDDTMLLAVINEFSRDGFHFESALEYCPELLVTHGFLTKRHPSSSQWKRHQFRLGTGQGNGASRRWPINCRRRTVGCCRRSD